MANEVYLNADGSLDSAITDLFAAADYVTIASGAITVTKSAAQVDTQSSAATDDLDTITMANIEDGKVLFIRSAAVGRTVVLKHLTGNIYNAGGDVRLMSPEHLAMLVYSGSKWVVMACGCGGSGETVPPIEEGDIDPGNEVSCVAAARMVEYLTYIINAAKAKISNTRVEIVEAFAGTIAIVQPAYSSPAVMALAAVFDTTYANAAAVDAVFTSGFYVIVKNILYCADVNEDGAISTGELAAATSELAALGTDEGDIIASLIGILGAAGLSNAVGLSSTVASSCLACDCEGDWIVTYPSWAGWSFDGHGEYYLDVLSGTYRGFVSPIGYTTQNSGIITFDVPVRAVSVSFLTNSDGIARSVAVFDSSGTLLASANPGIGLVTTVLSIPLYTMSTTLKIQTQATNTDDAPRATWIYNITVSYVC